MKTGLILGLVLVVLVGLIFGGMVYGTYSGLVEKRNAAQITAWSDVQAAYQLRFDTVPKFAKNAKFSAEFQIKLATENAKAREGVKDAAATGKPGQLQTVADEKFDGLVIAVRQEAAIEAKTDQLTELNAQIENVERVIKHERSAYNKAVEVYMTACQKPLAAAFISWFGWENTFPPMEAFQAQPGAEQSPDYDLELD